MHAFFTYCEANWQRDGEGQGEGRRRARAVRQGAGQSRCRAASTAGASRLIDDFLKGLRMKIAAARAEARARARRCGSSATRKDIVIDGKLDDAYWQNCPGAATGRLRELQTGRQPTFGTSFKAGWSGNSVYFAIRCDEHPGEKLNIAATRDGRPGHLVWRRRRDRARDGNALLLPDRRQSRRRGRRPRSRRAEGPVVRLGFAGGSRHAHRRRSLDRRDPHPRHAGRKRSAASGHRPQAHAEPALAHQHLPPAHPRRRRRNSAPSRPPAPTASTSR